MQTLITRRQFQWLLNLWARIETPQPQRRFWEPDPAGQPDPAPNPDHDLQQRLADLEHRVRYPAAFCCSCT